MSVILTEQSCTIANLGRSTKGKALFQNGTAQHESHRHSVNRNYEPSRCRKCPPILDCPNAACHTTCQGDDGGHHHNGGYHPTGRRYRTIHVHHCAYICRSLGQGLIVDYGSLPCRTGPLCIYTEQNARHKRVILSRPASPMSVRRIGDRCRDLQHA